MSASDFRIPVDLSVEAVNAAHQPTPATARRFARRGLRPVEAALLARYRAELSQNVLEIGSRGDGLTRALEHHAEQFTGVSCSGPELRQCRARLPEARFLQCRLADLDILPLAQFDAIVAGRCALDHLTDEQRRSVLGHVSRFLAPTGVLILSTHNLGQESLLRGPLGHALHRPWHAVTLATALRNHARLRRLQQRSYGHAMLNTPADAYSWLSYHVSRDQQQRQLEDHDLSLIECVDRCDEPVVAGGSAYREPELHFVARPMRW